eukprot:TRINITY_DN9731_c0_g1_i1.p1 TRINITY_DN9731_c0_g1~~TRINITY_DN9731_c0_g1_i1.p1  ORF type:complete len:474 (+),score=34.83 TRINITY_DN9731_c0_g1_i1:570-1991(+)
MYLHSNRVIHRDLKLGNIFLNDKLEVKIGDFGLATRLEFEGERKRTICGTPNYIAPEILEGKSGHSYEVDVWAIGIICYAILCGRPPFETTEVKATYKRIRNLQYSFPTGVQISDSARTFIQSILVLDPSKRPSLKELLEHPFFTQQPIPMSMPTSTLAAPPSTSWLRSIRTVSTARSAYQSPRNASLNAVRNSDIHRAMTDILASSRMGRVNSNGPKTRITTMTTEPGMDIKETKRMLTEAMNLSLGTIEPIRLIEFEVSIVTFKDLSLKFGLGYLLTNNSVGVCFNDASKMVLDPTNTHYQYYERTIDKIDVMSKHNYNEEAPPELKKKHILLQTFKSSFDKISSQAKVFTDNVSKDLMCVYVKKWIKTKHAYLFRLSNKLVQVYFMDNSQVILTTTSSMFMYVTKKGEKHTGELSKALESENQEMVKRVKYAKEILAMLIAQKRIDSVPSSRGAYPDDNGQVILNDGNRN